MAILQGSTAGRGRRAAAGLATALLLRWVIPSPAPAGAGIKKDETVVFYPTVAHRAAGGKSWVIPVHGWVFEPEEDSLLRGAAVALTRRIITDEEGAHENPYFRKRIFPFLADSEGGREVSIRLGENIYPLGLSGPDGHFWGIINLSNADVGRLVSYHGLPDGWVKYQAAAGKDDGRVFKGAVRFVEEEGISVISDIDDTIKVSEVRDRKALARNTFLREFERVPGMGEVYRIWAVHEAVFHYVSAGPWQLYEALQEFINNNSFPPGSFHLKKFRVKDGSFLDLFASPEEYKPGVIRPIMETFRRRRFILVGDSGEKDPEVYGDIARRYPGQVARIYIRDVTGEGPEAERYGAAFRDIDPKAWMVFREAAELIEQPIP